MGEVLEHVPCNLCGGRSTAPFLEMNGYAYRRCRWCGLVFQNPRPVFAALRKRYGVDYFSYEFSNQDNFFNLMKLGLRDVGFAEFYTGTARGSGDTPSFLDIGCATGLLLKHVRSNGWNVKGVEVCRESAEYGMENFGLDIFIGTLAEAALSDSSFDVVHLSHVIEHVPDPKGLLVEIRRILKPGGHMILTTPNVEGFQARAAGRDWRSAIPDHIYLFSRRTMGNLLASVGFHVVKQVSWGGIPLGKRPDFIKRPADRLAKLFNVGDVMLFHAKPA